MYSADSLSPPRIALHETPEETISEDKDPLMTDREYHTATVTLNGRITASDWYQDVRHLEFHCDDDISYVSTLLVVSNFSLNLHSAMSLEMSP